MTQHDDLYQSTAGSVLMDQHGELADLTPAGGSNPGVPKKGVTVRVDRSGVEVVSPDGHVRQYMVVVTIRRADLPSPVWGGDKIRLAPRRGGDLADLTLETLINDAGDDWVVAAN